VLYLESIMHPNPIPSDVRERITTAAAALFEQAGRTDFPTVDQVRRMARVDMNAASSVMREWRRQQTAQATPVAIAIPEAVQTSNSQALAALWLQAQELANDNLRSAQAAWETERAEMDAMRQEMATAFENQAAELEAVQVRLAEAHIAAETSVATNAKTLDALRSELAATITRAERAEMRMAEIENRADALQSERDQARQLASDARETGAKLAGQLEAIQAQNVALLAALQPSAASRKRP